MTINGFDFSHYQGSIDWHQVKASGIQFAYGKVVEGTAYPDATYPTNRANALAVGIVVGGYYWAHPNLDPAASANAFLARLNQVPGMLQPILDIEHNGNPTSNPAGAGGRTPTQIHNWIHAFRAVVQAKGYRLDIYTGGWFWNAYVLPGIPGGHCDECANSRLWLSRYASDMGAVPKPWTHASGWQYTETGTVPGVPSAGEDRDVLVGTETLADLIYTGVKPTPTPPEDDSMSAQDVSDLKAWFKPQIQSVNDNVDHAVKQIETDTPSGHSIANVQKHQDSQGEQMQALQDDVNGLKADVAAILKAVQK